MAEESRDLGPHRLGEDRRGGRSSRLAGRSGEVLTEGAVIRMDARALGSTVGLDVRRGIGLIARGFELRVGQRRGGRSRELDQRHGKSQEPQMQFAQPHDRKCIQVGSILPASSEGVGCEGWKGPFSNRRRSARRQA
jgi:hypothetical protein